MNIILRRSLTGVAESPWNQWQNGHGLGGRMCVESVAEWSWNTQAFPLSMFMDMIKAKSGDFFRVNWRNGRSSNVYDCGRPLLEGCMLAVKRTAVHLPDGKKLAWILKVNGKTAAIVDLQNNQLLTL